MGRIVNRKIIDDDGGVQWVFERTLGQVMHVDIIYFSLVTTPTQRQICAAALKRHRDILRETLHRRTKDITKNFVLRPSM